MEKAVQALARKGPTGAEIADWIRSQIKASRLVPGQRLIEVDIIRQTGGSRFKVREAFQRLAAEGLLEIEEFRGAAVRGASMEEVRQLYRARAALEGLCASDFTRKATAQDKEQLRQIAEQMDQCIDSGSPEQFGRLNAEWHAKIIEVSGNSIIADIVQRLNTPVHRLLFNTFYQGNRLREAVEDHRRIIDAIMADDAEGAERAMRQHVENGHRFLRNLDEAVHEEGMRR